MESRLHGRRAVARSPDADTGDPLVDAAQTEEALAASRKRACSGRCGRRRLAAADVLAFWEEGVDLAGSTAAYARGAAGGGGRAAPVVAGRAGGAARAHPCPVGPHVCLARYGWSSTRATGSTRPTSGAPAWSAPADRRSRPAAPSTWLTQASGRLASAEPDCMSAASGHPRRSSRTRWASIPCASSTSTAPSGRTTTRRPATTGPRAAAAQAGRARHRRGVPGDLDRPGLRPPGRQRLARRPRPADRPSAPGLDGSHTPHRRVPPPETLLKRAHGGRACCASTCPPPRS